MVDPLDSYSQTVSSVAAALTPHVASLRIGPGAGSAVVFAHDGLLLTNAHVVGSAHDGVAAFTDGTETRFDVVGADPLSDLAVLRAWSTTPAAAVLGVALLAIVGAAAGSIGWVARERAERQSRLTGQVELILDEVARREQQQKWVEALAAVRAETSRLCRKADHLRRNSADWRAEGERTRMRESG